MGGSHVNGIATATDLFDGQGQMILTWITFVVDDGDQAHRRMKVFPNAPDDR